MLWGGGGLHPLNWQTLPAGGRCANMFNNNEQLDLGQSDCDHQEKECKNLFTAEAVSGPVIWGVITETPGPGTESTVFS